MNNNRFLSTQAGKKFRKQIIEPVSTGIDWFFSLRLSSAIIYFVVCVAFAIFLIIDTADDRRRLMSAFGIVILVRNFADVIICNLGSISSTFCAKLLRLQILKGQKIQSSHQTFFALLGSPRVKALHKMLMKLNS